MLPGKDGFAVAAELRAAGQFVPILMLTARGRPEDVLEASRPAPTTTCPSRSSWRSCWRALNGLLRRRRWNEQDPPAAEPTRRRRLTFAGRTLDFAAMEMRVDGKSYRLTQMECDLLRYLVRTPASRSRAAPSSRTSGTCTKSTDTRAIDNFIVRLRRYLEDRPASPNSC